MGRAATGTKGVPRTIHLALCWEDGGQSRGVRYLERCAGRLAGRPVAEARQNIGQSQAGRSYDQAVLCTTVLFDLDGTLTDSEPGIIASYRHALGTFNKGADSATIRRWIGPPLEEGFAALGVPVTEVQAAIATYRAYFSVTGMYENSLYEGVAEMLGELRAAGMRLAVATSKLQEFAVTILDHFEIGQHFEVVAGATSDGRRTAKEDIVSFALASLGHPDPSTVALVGDREHDMRAAVRHSLHAIGAGWGYGDRDELQDSGSEVIAGDPTALARLLLPAHDARPETWLR